jgi:hypothetical protein
MTFFPDDVRKALKKLKKSCSTGADSIPQRLFSECHSSLALPLCDIYNWSMILSQTPRLWKHSLVTPIQKPGKDESLPSSYRPISITSASCKVMERLIVAKLLPYLIKYDIYSESQHGFRPNASVTTNLLCVENEWTKAISMGHAIDAIYLDFEKAFDTVSHTKLLMKCEHYGLPPTLVSWIKSFLVDRTFSVRIGSVTSHVLPVLSGVPQGSVLGPILFCLYTSDLSRMLSSFSPVRSLEYADDVKIFVSYKPTQPNNDASLALQSALDAVTTWCSYHELKLSLSKCSQMRLGSQKHRFQYSLSGVALDSPNQIRDLGMQIMPSFRKHASIVDRKNKGLAALYTMFRVISINSPELLIRCFKTYVLPHLDFSSQFYNPHLVKDIEAIEKVQRAFTRIVFYRCFPSPSYPHSLPSYSERLMRLELMPLNVRRSLFDLSTAFTIMHGKTILKRSDFFRFVPTRKRNGTFGIHIEFCKNTARFNSYPLRVARLFDKLPENILQSATLATFKKRVARWLMESQS